MENAVKTRLQSVQFGEAQTYKNIAIVPLIAPADGTFQYRTLGEALATWDIAITEVSAAGSVPELMVVNRAQQARPADRRRGTRRRQAKPGPQHLDPAQRGFGDQNPGQLHRAGPLVLRLQGLQRIRQRNGLQEPLQERPAPSNPPWRHAERLFPTRAKSGMASPNSRPKPAPHPPPLP